VSDEIGNVLDPLTQRRQPDRNHIQPEVKIFPEQALVDQVAQILVGCRDNANICLDRSSTANGGVFALLQNPQEARLSFHGHIADLVEEQRSAVGLLEPA